MNEIDQVTNAPRAQDAEADDQVIEARDTEDQGGQGDQDKARNKRRYLLRRFWLDATGFWGKVGTGPSWMLSGLDGSS